MEENGGKWLAKVSEPSPDIKKQNNYFNPHAKA